jgi:hypothetical protein
MHSVFHASGFQTNSEKDELGQMLVFLGFLINTIAMSVSFSPEKAASTEEQIRTFCLKQKAEWRVSDLSEITGTLNHYSEFLQTGRLHLRSLYNALYPPPSLQIVFPRIHYSFYKAIEKDLLWWLKTLQVWIDGGQAATEFPIINTATLFENPSSIIVVQSDYSPDGIGYLWGPLNTIDVQVYAAAFTGEIPTHSHAGELSALDSFMQSSHAATLARGTLLFWITDGQGAVMSLNSGSCSDPESFNILSNILERAVVLNVYIVGLWVPRDQNRTADYLSHLACFLNRSSYEGSLHQTQSELAFETADLRRTYDSLASSIPDSFRNIALPSRSVSDRLQEESPRDARNLSSFPGVLSTPPPTGPASPPPPPRTVPLRSSVPPTRFNEVAAPGPFTTPPLSYATSSPLAGRSRLPDSARAHIGPAIRGSSPIGSKVSADIGSTHTNFQPSGPFSTQRPLVTHTPLAGSRWTSSPRRDSSSPPCARYRMGSPSTLIQSTSLATQDPPFRFSSVDPVSHSQRSLCSPSSSTLVPDEQSRPKSGSATVPEPSIE